MPSLRTPQATRRADLRGTSRPIESIIPNRTEFTSRLVNTRDYLTHYDEASKLGAVSGQALYVLTRQLRGVLTICLLRELGLPESLVDSIVSDSRPFRDLSIVASRTERARRRLAPRSPS